MHTRRNEDPNLMLPPDKNLHASLPALLARMQKAAADEKLSVDQFVADAIERYLSRRELDEVLSFGNRHARERGLQPADVAGAIRDARAGDSARGR